MRRHEESLSPEQRQKLEKYFMEFPHLKTIWEFKQKLHSMMRLKMLSRTSAWYVIHDFLRMIKELKQSPIEALKTLGEALFNWREEVGRMWRFSKTNSITEGLHNKMEMISRRALALHHLRGHDRFC